MIPCVSEFIQYNAALFSHSYFTQILFTHFHTHFHTHTYTHRFSTHTASPNTFPHRFPHTQLFHTCFHTHSLSTHVFTHTQPFHTYQQRVINAQGILFLVSHSSSWFNQELEFFTFFSVLIGSKIEFNSILLAQTANIVFQL